ncbi:UNVERIFIED_ORG: ATP-binding protein [Bacillus sp. AZ43]
MSAVPDQVGTPTVGRVPVAPSVLRSLRPKYEDDQHGQHVVLLLGALRQPGADAPRNIALTGHYGSGKSSVIAEVERQLRAEGVEVVNLSLPSLGVGNDRPTEVEPARETTNLIQKEIVKQLLYRKAPTAMPASRYRRLDMFRWRSALGWSAIVAAVAGFLGLLSDLPGKVGPVLPSRFTADHKWTPWLAIPAVMLLAWVISIGLTRLVHNRIRIEKFTAGPATVALSDENSSYFDEYLDEIVYFFQKSRTSVAIFEDLDRFKDPHIFETLREVNTLLNSAEQLKTRPIRFVYAIRDSIFEELGVDAAGDDSQPESTDTQETETRRLTSTNRTKFFDLVLPMVPFISHRTSRDLIRRELASLPDEYRPQVGIVDLVGAHLTDMRLIKNICNEYEIFAQRILPPRGLKELDADRLFAMMVYKNLYLRDFESVREGTSSLDDVYRQYRVLVSEQADLARRRGTKAQAQLERLDDIVPRSRRYGDRLLEALRGTVAADQFNATQAQVQVPGKGNFVANELHKPEFWHALFAQRSLTFAPRSYIQPVSFQLEQIERLMGVSLSLSDWSDEDRAQLEEEAQAARDLRRVVTRASMAEVFERVDLTVTYDGEPRTLSQVSARLVGDAALPLELLRRGYIDENFTLYVADFHGVSVPVAAMNFILHAVQGNEMDIPYHFDAPEDIDAVVREEAERLLAGRSVYNIEIFDRLLETDPDRLASPLSRLAASATSDTEFIDAYIASGQRVSEFIERVSGLWPGTFTYLVGLEGVEDEALRARQLNAALAGARLTVNYTIGVAEREAIERRYASLALFNQPLDAPLAARVARLLQRFGVQIRDLSVVPQTLRAELVGQRIFPVTHTNLVAVLGTGSSLSLDAIRASGADSLYPHVLAHLDDYFQVVAEASLQTVSDAGAFVAVLVDVHEAAPDALEEVARRATGSCVVSDLSAIEPAAWPALAAAQRFPLTLTNVAAYIDEHGVDQAFADHASACGAISELDDSQATRMSLAITLMNAPVLEDDAKISLLSSLNLESYIDPDLIVDQAVTIIPALVRADLIVDNAAAYARLSDREWSTKERLIEASDQFSNYLPELELSSADVTGIATSRAVPDAAKDWLLGQVVDLREALEAPAATALAERASSLGGAQPSEVVAALAGAQASQPAILRLLALGVGEWSLEQIQPIVHSLGEPYSQLLERGHHRPKVPNIPGVAQLLARLRRVGAVSSYSEDSWKPEYKVNMRRE